MPDPPEWPGITLRTTCDDRELAARDRLADAAKAGRWDDVFAVLAERPALVNDARIGGTSRFTPLHHAAELGAAVDVATRLVEIGAWRTLRDARGERPVDVAARRGMSALREALEPIVVAPISASALAEVQAHFHVVIRGRAARFVQKHSLRLPELEPLSELGLHRRIWFAVPGMVGGFVYWLDEAGDAPRLVTESWCRVVGGSGQRHSIDRHGARLVAEGFV